MLHNRELWRNGKEGVKGGKKVKFERISVQRSNRMSSRGTMVFDWSFESVLEIDVAFLLSGNLNKHAQMMQYLPVHIHY